MQNAMRQRQMAAQIARGRDLFMWWGSFYTVAFLGGIAGWAVLCFMFMWWGCSTLSLSWEGLLGGRFYVYVMGVVLRCHIVGSDGCVGSYIFHFCVLGVVLCFCIAGMDGWVGNYIFHIYVVGVVLRCRIAGRDGCLGSYIFHSYMVGVAMHCHFPGRDCWLGGFMFT